MMWLRPLGALALSLVLMAGSVTLAVARAEPGFAGWMELCSGAESRTVAVDAQGEPLKPAHPCPDCLTGFAATLPGTAPPPAPPLHAGTSLRPTLRAAAPSRHARHAQARAPPLLT